MRFRTFVVCSLLLFVCQTFVWAAPRVDVVIGVDAPKTERYAADELASQFARLFDVEAKVVSTASSTATATVLLGSPKTNPAVKAAVGDKWPKLSDQGIVIRSLEKNRIVVGGGSPAATLWAAYELGHQKGVRYLLRGDIYPLAPIPLKLDGLNIVSEPVHRTRTWRTVNDFAIGPESWGIAEHRRVLAQLAKMKFNRVMLSFYPGQPFVHYEYGGVEKQTGVLFFGEKYRVDGETPGKATFKGAKFFENPDFVGAKTYQQRTAAGVKLASGIIRAAHDLGMQVGISISPLEFPREFASVLPGAQASRGINDLTITPGTKQRPDDATLKGLVAAKIRAYLKTYPTVDQLYLTLPEFPQWGQHAEAAWQLLGKRVDLGDQKLDALVQSAAKRGTIATGQRGMNAVKGNVVALAFLHSLLDDTAILKRPDGKKIDLTITSLDPALYGVADRVVPRGASTLHFVDYTARRVVENAKLLADVPADKVNSRLILSLADDNIGVTTQSAVAHIHTLLAKTRKLGWDGFSTRYWMASEQDPTVYYLSRAAYDAKVTPRSAHDDLFVAITDNKPVADRLWLGFQHVEQATDLIDRNDLGFSFPVKGMLMKHYRAEPLPKWWEEMTGHYTQYLIELYRANSAVDRRANPLLYYYAKRSEYVLEYLGAVKAVREAALAKKKGDNEAALEKLEVAIESLYNCMDTLNDIAANQSDRGLIATLNAYAFVPLMAEYERLADEE